MATEKRLDLIDRQKLFNDLADYWGIPKDWDGQIERLCEDALCAIENAPTVDAVEVVRCKDCKYWERLTDGNLCGACNGQRNGLTYEYTTEDDFCSYGERREGDA